MTTKIIEKTWGHEAIVYNNEYCVKTLSISPASKTSQHYHRIKHETMTVVSGVAYMHFVNKTVVLHEGKSIIIEPKTTHCIENPSSTLPLLIVESSTFDSAEDSVRV